MNTEISNPILRGMYPDPSICRVGSKYYLANSTFTYVPGIPIFESDDLINWKQIGHILERESQLDLKDMEVSSGIFAPTLRYHKGIFYMITTNAGRGGTFYVTAKEPQGPWSEPVFLKDAEGIDPSLYFEGDKCFYVGQRFKKDAKYYGDCEIWIQELDLERGCLTGEAHAVWDGAAKNAIWPEGPHLYRKDDWYSLMIAEGGTAHEHSVSVARSREIFGPYESCKNNPVFTHRHLGEKYPIQNIGHADLIEMEDGSWYAVMLGTRMLDGRSALGRETFLVPVIWENDWPVFYAGEGKVPVTDTTFGNKREKRICWEQDLDLSCVMLRKQLPKERYHMENGRLYLQCGRDALSGTGNPSYIGVRVEEYNFSLETGMCFTPEDGEEAGLIYFYNAENYLTVSVCGADKQPVVKITKREKGNETILFREACVPGSYRLRIEGKQGKMTCFLNQQCLTEQIPLEAMTTEEAGGFVGCTMGVFAVAENQNSNTEAIFEKLELAYS